MSKLKKAWLNLSGLLLIIILLSGWLWSKNKNETAVPANLPPSQSRLTHIGLDADINFDATNPAIAYNSTDLEFMLVWQSDTALDGKIEIFAQRLTNKGTPINTPIQISSVGTPTDTSRAAQRPTIAYNSNQNEYLVVWQADDSDFSRADDEWDIFGRRIDSTGNPIGNTISISTMGPNGNPDYDAFAPAIAYQSNTNTFIIVWHGDHNLGGTVDNEMEIYGQVINATTGAKVGNNFRISASGGIGDPNYDAEYPAVTASNNRYFVVWQADDNTLPLIDDEFEIYGELINSNTGLPLGTGIRLSDMGIDGDPTFDAIRPSVVYNNLHSRYLVSWTGNDGTGSMAATEQEIFAQLVASTKVEIGPNDFRISQIGIDGDTNYNAFHPSLSYDSFFNHYIVNWRSDSPTTGNNQYQIFGQRLDSLIGGTAPEIGRNDYQISQMGDTADYFADHPAISPIGELFVVWQADDHIDGSNNELEIYGSASCLNSTATPPIVSITQSANDLLLSWPDDAANSNGYQILTVTNAPFNYQRFAPLATGTTNWIDNAKIGAPITNHYYVVQGLGDCFEASADSNQVGEFDFTIIPGS